MRIKSASIHNYKSIEEVNLRDLRDLVVLHGENNVGKSNVLQGLALPFELLTQSLGFGDDLESELTGWLMGETSVGEHFLREHGQLVRSGASTKLASIELVLELDQRQCEVARSELKLHHLQGDTVDLCLLLSFHQPVRGALQYEVASLEFDGVNLLDDHEIRKTGKIGWFLAEHMCSRFIRLGPWRHFRKEVDDPPLSPEEQDFPRGLVENVKRYLFAYKNSGVYQARYSLVVDTLARLVPEIGRLDLVREPNRELEVYIDGPSGRLPIANLGSGYQQAALMLSCILLSGASTVVLEEPEMNLSWESQKLLRGLLDKLVRDPASPVDQVILSAHSRFFRGDEYWLEVTADQGLTRVTPVSYDERQPPFDQGEEEQVRGIRLTRYGQIPLPQKLVEELGLKPYDPVYVIKNEETGRWELRTQAEVDQHLFDDVPSGD